MYTNPHQVVDRSAPQQAPSQPEQFTPEQIRAALAAKIIQIRQDLTTALNPYSLQKCLGSLCELVEYMVTGQVTQANPNQVPGQPAAPMDDGKPKVQFFGGPGQQSPAPPPQVPQPGQPPAHPAPQAAAPVNNGDVQFIPSAGGGGGNEQKVEFFGGPGQPVAPAAPAAPPASSGNLAEGGQKVELFGGPPAAASNPVSNEASATMQPGAPAANVAAGEAVPQTIGEAPAGGTVQPSFLQQPAQADESKKQAPKSKKELLDMLPIPPA